MAAGTHARTHARIHIYMDTYIHAPIATTHAAHDQARREEGV